MKREFKVCIKRVETCVVVVSADDESTAKDVALDQESMGMVDGYVYDCEQVVVEPLALNRQAGSASTVLPVADGGSRLGHVMIDPQNGMNGFTAWSVIDHHESEGSGVRSLTESTSVNPRLCDRHNHLLIVSGTRFGKPHRRGKDVKFVPRRFSREAAILI